MSPLRRETGPLLLLVFSTALVALGGSAWKPEGSNAAAAQRLINTPTSVQWRHPYGDFPEARTGSIPRFPGLSVVNLTLPEGALFDADTGIYVVGNAIWHTDEEAVKDYPDDQKWWKYPGNFHFRGKEWERSAHMELFAPDGGLLTSTDVGLRINGNNTRGFPQHALRVILPEPSVPAFFGEERGNGYRRILLRSSGNDQDRTFFRDQYQHALCAGMPFETSAGDHCVVFINGAYWGLHNLRERMDEHELARRYHVKPKRLAILEDRLQLYHGDSTELKRFTRLLTWSDRWSEAQLPDSLSRYMDLEGFLHYMAAQMILANIDWPDQNGKWWRYTGRPDTTRSPLDGRWHWIMGDSDQGFGIATGPEYDMFQHVTSRNAPLARLFNNCMRSAALRTSFRSIVLRQLDGPLARERMMHLAAAERDRILAEMPRHIRRWRRPLTMNAWSQHVAALLTFAERRGEIVRVQLDQHFPAASPN